MTTTTFDLDAEIRAIIRRQDEAEETMRVANEERAARQAEESRAKFEIKLRDELGPELCAALNLDTSVYPARLEFDGLSYEIERGNGCVFRMQSPTGDRRRRFYEGFNEREVLLRKLAGIVRQKEERRTIREREAREREERTAKAEAEAEAAASRKRAEYEERITNLAAEDAEVRPVVEQAMADARSQLWSWPNDTRIKLYRITWQRGAWRDESGEAEFDYERAYTFHPVDFGPDSGVAFVAHGHRWPGEPLLTLYPWTHPVTEGLVLWSIDDIPPDLRETVRGRVPNVCETEIRHAWDGGLLDKSLVFFGRTDPELGRGHEFAVGERPVSWLRNRIDTMATVDAADGGAA